MVEIALAMIREFLATNAGAWCVGATVGAVLRALGWVA